MDDKDSVDSVSVHTTRAPQPVAEGSVRGERSEVPVSPREERIGIAWRLLSGRVTGPHWRRRMAERIVDALASQPDPVREATRRLVDDADRIQRSGGCLSAFFGERAVVDLRAALAEDQVSADATHSAESVAGRDDRGEPCGGGDDWQYTTEPAPKDCPFCRKPFGERVEITDEMVERLARYRHSKAWWVTPFDRLDEDIRERLMEWARGALSAALDPESQDE